MDGVREKSLGKYKANPSKSGKTHKAQADKHRAPQKPFQIGSKVYLSTKYLRLKLPCKKLGPKFIGPFPIVKVSNPVTVQLKLLCLLGKVHPVFHSSLLKPAVDSQLRPVDQEAPKPILVQGKMHYEIKRMLDSRSYKGRLQYLVQCSTKLHG